MQISPSLDDTPYYMAIYMFNSIIDAIAYYSQKTPDKLCLRDSGGSISYRQYFEKICLEASALKKMNVKKGNHVVIKSAQSIDFLSAFHAVQLLGAVPVPLEKSVKADRLVSICKETESVLCIGDKLPDGFNGCCFKQLCENTDTAEKFPLPEKQDVGEILFTTGTTGKSKGVVMCHGADVAVAQNVIYGVEMKKDNVEVIPMPLNHSFALRRYYANMVNGSCAILLDGVIFFNSFFECFEKYGATSAALAPSALSILLKIAKNRFADCREKIDYLQLGSAHLPENEKKQIKSLLPDARLYNIYGSSEAGCSCVLNFNTSDDLPYCIGKPTANSKIVFVDENGNETEACADSPARLITGGEMLMKEYYGDKALTDETLINSFVYSNDVGYKDKNGRVFMLGRMDDVIICGGNKIAPADVEAVCLEYEGVTDCALIGKADKLMGQIPKLFVVVNENYDEDEMIQFLTERLEAFQVPKAVQIIDEIPKTYNGKTLRKNLQNL